MPGLLRRRKALGSTEGAWFHAPWERGRLVRKLARQREHYTTALQVGGTGTADVLVRKLARQREHYTTDFKSVVLGPRTSSSAPVVVDDCSGGVSSS